MQHYSDDCELHSPYIQKLLGGEQRVLIGKNKIWDFWQLGPEKAPSRKLELIDIAEGVETLAIYYTSIRGRHAIEIMFFNEQ